MGLFLLYLLSCMATQQYSILKVNHSEVLETAIVGPPIQKAQWKEPPLIRICKTTGIDLFRVQKAIKYWEMLGYEFGNIKVDYDAACMEPRHGEIIITLPDGNINNEHIAATRIYTEKIRGNIAKAKIFIFPKYARRERVIEHELGHALGWQHYKQKFHIMHPDWLSGGYGHSGLRK